MKLSHDELLLIRGRCNEPSFHLTYDIRQDVLSLFIPRIDPKRVFWNGRGSTPNEALTKYDIDQVFFVDELPNFIQTWANHTRNRHADIYGLHSSQIPGCSKRDSRNDTTSLQPAMNNARLIKDEHEVKLIRKANDISSQAHKEVLANILKFKNEAQVEGLFLNVCISQQAKHQAYDPIAASGPNAGTLHYDANNEDFGDRQVMCLDAGCEFELYASDITRTFPLSTSWPSQEAEDIYKLVERMQEECIEKLAPGVRFLDLHIRAHQIAIDGLLQLGILHNGTREEIYKSGTSKAFFPHGLGHHVGLEVHDVGQAELMSVRRGKPYEQVRIFYDGHHANGLLIMRRLPRSTLKAFITLYTTQTLAVPRQIRKVATWKRVWLSRSSQASTSPYTRCSTFTSLYPSMHSTSILKFSSGIYQLAESALKTIYLSHREGTRI